MTENPTDTLTRVADGLRRTGTPIDGLLADVLTAAAADFEMVNRINSRDPHNDGKTRVMAHPIAERAFAYATALDTAAPAAVDTTWAPPDWIATGAATVDWYDERYTSFTTWFEAHFTGGWGAPVCDRDPAYDDPALVPVAPTMYDYDTDTVLLVACRECGAALPLHPTWVKGPVHLNAHRVHHDRFADDEASR